jgi:hypothetical protein
VPLWKDGSDAWQLTLQIHRYQHTIAAMGGYWSASFTIRGGRHLADDWLQDGLGRHVQVYDDALVLIWEGFVDSLDVNYGPLSVVRGPLLDTANRVDLVYSTVEYDENGLPVVGTRVNTGEADDTDSQDLWGILPKILSTGGCDPDDAEAIRDTYLESHAVPATTKQWTSDARGQTSVTVNCLGYVHWLNWAYNSTTTGTDDADDKILAVLADSPNVAWLDFGTLNVDTNTLQVKMWEDEDNLAWSVIKGIVARGDASQNRWLFGVYGDLEAYYEAAPTDVEYQQRLSDPAVRVEYANGGEVYPWNVMPGRWIFFPDFLIGQAPEADLADDPRAMFIEEVRYTMPWTLQLSGGTLDRVDQLMAQMGLSGIGA